MAPGQQSPYSAISAMAIDPIYIRVPDVPEFAALGGEASLTAADRELLDAVRRAPAIDYAGVRRAEAAVAAGRVRSVQPPTSGVTTRRARVS